MYFRERLYFSPDVGPGGGAQKENVLSNIRKYIASFVRIVFYEHFENGEKLITPENRITMEIQGLYPPKEIEGMKEKIKNAREKRNQSLEKMKNQKEKNLEMCTGRRMERISLCVIQKFLYSEGILPIFASEFDDEVHEGNEIGADILLLDSNTGRIIGAIDVAEDEVGGKLWKEKIDKSVIQNKRFGMKLKFSVGIEKNPSSRPTLIARKGEEQIPIFVFAHPSYELEKVENNFRPIGSEKSKEEEIFFIKFCAELLLQLRKIDEYLQRINIISYKNKDFYQRILALKKTLEPYIEKYSQIKTLVEEWGKTKTVPDY